MKRNSLAAGLLVLIAAASCQKKDSTTVNADGVTISISSPTEGRVFHIGDTVHIDAEISYATQLHGYTVQVKDKATGRLLYDNEGHTHDSKLTVADHWVADSARAAQLVLTTVIDHENHEQSKTINFSIQP